MNTYLVVNKSKVLHKTTNYESALQTLETFRALGFKCKLLAVSDCWIKLIKLL